MKRFEGTSVGPNLGLGLAAALVAVAAFALVPQAMADCGACAAKGADAAATGAGCGGGPGAGSGCCAKGRGAGPNAGAGMGGAGMGAGMAHHDNIQTLLDQHDAIQRYVEEVEGGVDTVTTSHDPELVKVIREHVRQMQQRVESGQGMRWWDPTFAELFRHADAIELEVEDIPGGVRVRETSADPQVVKLIRQHAQRAVSEFVARGRDRAAEPTPLPEGYAGVSE